MKISKKAEYGLRAMIFLAKNPRLFSLREIASKTKMPFVFLEKIFSKLEKAKLVKAKLGMRGGYFLARPASKITPADVVAALEEDIATTHCQGCPMAGGCASKDVWGEVQQSLNSALGATTLAKLAKSPARAGKK